MSSSPTYRARFRFRLEKKLNIPEKEHRIKIDSREIVISPQLPDINISDSEWLVINAREFASEEEAISFSDRLKLACEVSSVSARLGIDSGKNLPTAGFGQLVKDRVKAQTGIVLRSNVHGVDVFRDDPNIIIANFSATETVRASHDPFLTELSSLYEEVDKASPKTKDIVLLLNYALMRPDPVAKIVFAFSAVEMLGQIESWSSEQASLLKVLAASARDEDIGTESEREEVAVAIEKGLHKLSLRQGVLRLLSSLDLGHLKKTWDNLYSERSTLVHGLAPMPGVDYSGLAHRAVGLCGQILLAAISKEIPSANSNVAKFYDI